MEDGDRFGSALVPALLGQGFDVEWSRDGLQGLDLARSRVWTAVILDLMIPTLDGATVLRRLREASIDRLVDAASLEIVLQNLVADALAHSPEGEDVEVRLVEVDGAVRLEVEDHGEGIAPEDRTRIFERMWRADRVRSRDEGRFGLGLSIARRHATLLGARIEVRSEVGRGSVFSLVFPA